MPVMSRAQAPAAPASAQQPAPATTPAPAATPPRPVPPTRDPRTPGYVTATDVPDGTLPPPDVDGNFVVGPTHVPAPRPADRRRPGRHGLQPDDELDGQQNLSRHRARCGHVRHTRSERSGEADRDDESSRAVHAQGRRLRAEAVRRRHRRAVHRRGRWAGSPALRDARQPDLPEACAGDGGDLDRQRQRRRAGQPARSRVRHDVGTLRGVRRERGDSVRRAAVQREADEGSRRARDDGRKLGRGGGAHHGVVSPGAVPPRAVGTQGRT